MEYEKRYVDEPDKWQPVSKKNMLRELEGYWKDIDLVIAGLDEGTKFWTPFAHYRKKK